MVDIDQKIDKLLKQHPVQVRDLAVMMGGGQVAEAALLAYHHKYKLPLKPVDPIYPFIASLAMLLLVEIIPIGLFHSIIALVTIIAIPYYWTAQFPRLQKHLVTGLVVAELMIIGMILGYFASYTTENIGLGLICAMFIKYLLLIRQDK